MYNQWLNFQELELKDYYKSRSYHPSRQISSRILGSYHRFFAGFTDSSGIGHSLSKGESREVPVREFFESLLPKKFEVSSGEIIDSEDRVSSQTDLVIYRTEDGIPILNQQPTILPVESMMSVVEVKSTITCDEYRDCLKKAQKLYELKPFGYQLQKQERGRDPKAEECRIFISVFAYNSNSKGELKEEYERYIKVAKGLNIDLSLIDRIYILGKGIIDPAAGSIAADTVERKIGLFYLYSNSLQFLMREANRRKEVP